MKTPCCIAASLLMAVLLFPVGEATDCQFRHFEMGSCIDGGSVNFDRLIDPNYSQEMCSALQPVVTTCIGENRNECPDIRTFQGAQGRAINRLLRSHRRVCSGRGGGRGHGGSGRACPQDQSAFAEKLGLCHSPLQMNLRDNQMCEPILNVTTCMKELTRRNRHCAWLTRPIKRQLRLGVDYYGAIRAVKYSCE